MLRFIRFLKKYDVNRHNRVMQFSIYFFLWAIAFSLFDYFAPLYLENLGLSYFKIGIILSGSSFISFFIDPFLGQLQKKFPAKTLLLSSIFLFVLNIILFIKSGNLFFILFLATNIYGVAFDLFSITSYTKVFENSIEKDRSTNISFFESFYSLGLLIGALIVGFVASSNLNNIPYLCFLVLIFLFFVILFAKKEKMDVTDNFSIIESYKKTLNQFKFMGRGGLILVFALIFIHLFDGFFFIFEPIFAQKFQGYFLDEFIIGGILLAVYTLPIILFEPKFGKLEDKYGRKKFLFLGFSLGAVSLFLLRFFDGVFMSGLFIFLSSLGFFAMALPAVEGMYESITEKKFGKNYRGYSVSIMELTLSVGFLLGPFLGGIMLSMPDGFNFAFKIFSYVTLGIMLLISFFVDV
ncbi:MAG: MFS transporter [Candidatus Woesearchaeota archaeon]